MHHPFRAASIPHLVSFPTVPPREYTILTPRPTYFKLRSSPRLRYAAISMYDDSIDLYDHMLHFNQTMILSAGNDYLLCKVFPVSLNGPTLAWFHKLMRGSINSFQRIVGSVHFLILMFGPTERNISSL